MAAPWPKGAPLECRAGDDVADGSAVGTRLAGPVLLRSSLPVSDRRLRQRRQFDAPRRRVSDAVHRARPRRDRGPGRAAAALLSTGSLLVAFASAPLAACLAVPEPYAIDRELELLPFGVLIAVAGARHLMTASAAGVAREWRGTARGRSALLRVLQRGLLPGLSAQRGVLVRLELAGTRSANWSRSSLQWHPATIYLSTHHVGNLGAYWKLYLSKDGRRDLLPRTVPFDSDGFDVKSIQPGSLLLVGRDDTALTAALDAGLLRSPRGDPGAGGFRRSFRSWSGRRAHDVARPYRFLVYTLL